VIRVALRANAIFDAVIGCVLLLATWDSFYSAVHLPDTDAAVYPQVAGAFVVAVAYLLWISHRDAKLLRAAALTGGIAHGLGAGVAVSWLVDTRVALPGHDELALGCLAALFAGFAVVDLAIASRSVAMLVPAD
jgi:hypothetical protein